MPRVLMIAFQFPPFAGSSAVQRTLRFVRYLPECGWEPIVLTAHARAYEISSEDQLRDVAPGTVVERAFSLDAARHFGIGRRYPGWCGRPDRWISWWPGGVVAGLEMIRRYRPAALWSTFPIPTAHLIARTLQRRSGLPWIADFRDPMVQPGDPSDPRLWRAYERVEQTTVRRSQLNVFTTPGTRALYRTRYPDLPDARLAVVENGYDEEIFASLADGQQPSRDRSGKLRLLHSGAIYPLERDPSRLFLAIRRLADAGFLSAETFSLRLRATGHDADIAKLIERCDVSDIVELAPSLPYREAIAEMIDADGLVVLQASEVRTQVPAKIYEYLRAGRPIIALTDPDGDTARVLNSAGVRHIARIDSQADIERVLVGFVGAVRTGSVALPDPEFVRLASRRHRTRELAALLERVTSETARTSSGHAYARGT